MSACPYEQSDEDVGMSNFGHEVDPGTEEELRGKEVWVEYAAWDFYGRVWLDRASGRFRCEVWRYGSPVDVTEARSLAGLMRVTSDKWGWK